ALGTTLQIGWKSARGVRAALLAALTLVAVLVLHLPTLLAILLLGGLGVLLFRAAPIPRSSNVSDGSATLRPPITVEGETHQRGHGAEGDFDSPSTTSPLQFLERGPGGEA
ncbi:MAG TPA: hypothetical protein VFD32_23010, partial [Dehalococcoidia bacterium]|nr:hypothetical protein [Dehalococcoidia bacterium]